MAKKGDNKGGGFNPFFGIFDFNRDGKTDVFEMWMAQKMYEDWSKEENSESLLNDVGHHSNRYAWRNNCEDGFEYDVDPEDYETEEEYNEALEEAKNEWRDTCEDGFDVGIDPDDYDSEEEYEEALSEARNHTSIPAISIPITLRFSVETPGQEALNAIKQSDYPNKRKYDAAYQLCQLKQGTAYIPEDTTEQDEIEKCEFILNSEAIAANYITVYGDFLLAQAVKENFTVPVTIPEEDDSIKTSFYDLIVEIAEEDTKLAVEIWRWCVQEFGPYKKYIKNNWPLYNGVISSVNDCPKEFLDDAVKAIGNDASFCTGLLTQNPQFPYYISPYIGRALELGLTKEAQAIFCASISNPVRKSTDLEDLIDGIISSCSNWEELETMETLKYHLLPIIKGIDDKRIQRLLPQFIEKIDHYISYVEQSSEKYQFSRRYAWRKKCIDGSEYHVDPLKYETEEAYNEAIQDRKYGWRKWSAGLATQYDLDPKAFETENEFKTALNEKRNRQLQELRGAKRKTQYDDPLAETDMAVYTFCGVTFPQSNTTYHYRTDDETLCVGDKVIVPVGKDEKEVVAEVVTVEKHRRKTAPYPVDKAKFIKCRFTEEDEDKMN